MKGWQSCSRGELKLSFAPMSCKQNSKVNGKPRAQPHISHMSTPLQMGQHPWRREGRTVGLLKP